VQKGDFREELYYRLNVVELTIPPLRERRDDIPPLCRYFLERYAREFNKPVRRVADEVISIFMAYDFPGNVRELEHVIERAVILSEGDCLQADHLPERFKTAAAVKKATEDNYMTLAEREKQYILEVLQAADGNKSRTAELLGISRAALWRKLKLFQQDP
jgi:transcriptional regulator with PAS, ATPase and Fis domain